MESPIHRFRHNTKAIAYGNPGWEKARENHLIDLRVRVGANDRLVVDGSGFEFVNLSSCSYLGLHDHPALLEEAVATLRREKVLDVPISRVRIRLALLDDFEARLTSLFRAPSIATVTATAATSGVLPLLASGHLENGEPRVMVFDKHCHFSMNLMKPICADETEVLTSGHNDLDFGGTHRKADGAWAPAGVGRAAQRGAHVRDQRIDGRTSQAQMKEDGVGDVGQHSIERRFVGEFEREEEFRVGHEAGFYSERRSNSTRARVQSAAICACSCSSVSKGRSSRMRCTKPRRTGAP